MRSRFNLIFRFGLVVIFFFIQSNFTRLHPVMANQGGQQTLYLPMVLNYHAGEEGKNPFPPSNPSPANSSMVDDESVTLTWSGGDPNGKSVTYDVYFEEGDSTPDQRVSAGQTTTSYTTVTLMSGATFYWQIISTNQSGKRAAGPVWSFSRPALSTMSISAGGGHTCAITTNGGVICWGDNEFGQLGDDTTTNRLKPIAVPGLSSGVQQVSAGQLHTCALTESGGVKCWGRNNDGQLGDGSLNDHFSPADVYGLTSGVKTIVTGYYHTCAIKSNGAVVCWGWNESGQVGDSTRSNKLIPASVSGLTQGVQSLALGLDHSCALKENGGVLCWGANDAGEIGDGTQTDRLTPVNVSGLTGGATSIAVGMGHSCASLNTGAIRCWGYNSGGQIGDGSTATRLAPVAVSNLGGSAVAVTADGVHTCALLSNGGARCWGDNDYGQLGDSTTYDRLKPVNVYGLTSGAAAVSAGYTHTCALKTNNTMQCWGNNASGQLGNNTIIASLTPVDVVDNADNQPPFEPANPAPQDMSTEQQVTSLLQWSGGDPDNDPVAYEVYFEAGDSSPDVLVSPAQYESEFDPGLLVSETTYFWQIIATDDSGQTSIGPVWSFTTENQAPTVPFNPAPLQNAVDRSPKTTLSWSGGDPDGNPVTYDVFLEAGDSSPDVRVAQNQTATGYDPGILLDNTIYYWQVVAKDSRGKSTTGPVWVFTVHNLAPVIPFNPFPLVDVTNQPTEINLAWSDSDPNGDLLTYDVYLAAGIPDPTVAVASGLTAAFYDPGALLYNRTYYWKVVSTDPFGQSTTSPIWSFSTTTSAAYENSDRLAAGFMHTCAINGTGGAQCWGEGGDGQLGIGSTDDRHWAAPVTGLSNGVLGISAGYEHTCALTSTGGAKCWGHNTSGQLGAQTYNISDTPVDVTGLTSGVVQVAAGAYFSCALSGDGGVKCWGKNDYRQLGNGGTDNSLTPVDVIGLDHDITQITLGFAFGCALNRAGGVQCWGANSYGQLGSGTTANILTVVPVSGLSSGVKAISAGNAFACALLDSGGLRCWGGNTNGELGNGTIENSSVPLAVSGLNTGVTRIDASNFHACAIFGSGGMKCWGYNQYRQLGDNNIVNRLVPYELTSMSSGVTAITGGMGHTCGLLNTGDLKCWGMNSSGQLGSDTLYDPYGIPTVVEDFSGN